MPLHHPDLVVEPKTVTSFEFFTVLFPQIMEKRKEVCMKLGGTFAFRLHGDEGGEWTVDLGSCSIKSQLDRDASLLLEISNDDFLDLLKGKLNLELAMQQPGRIALTGEIARLSSLAVVLDPAGNAEKRSF
jgi:hypothetical protein